MLAWIGWGGGEDPHMTQGGERGRHGRWRASPAGRTGRATGWKDCRTGTEHRREKASLYRYRARRPRTEKASLQPRGPDCLPPEGRGGRPQRGSLQRIEEDPHARILFPGAKFDRCCCPRECSPGSCPRRPTRGSPPPRAPRQHFGHFVFEKISPLTFLTSAQLLSSLSSRGAKRRTIQKGERIFGRHKRLGVN